MSGVMGDRYQVVRELARGGMGRVLLAEDRLLKRRVAVKTLINLGDPAMQLRFVEEAQITGQLAHPDVVAVHELGRSENGAPFLAMKLVEGRDLQALIRDLADGDRKTQRKYPLPRLLRIFLKVCEPVAYAHDHGVIHRDLKPANVMVGQGDEVLVMDWGLAKPVGGDDPQGPLDVVTSVARQVALGDTEGDLTGYGAVVGTPAYMAPEQADGHDVDMRADVYSLGAILYEALTHRPPFRGGAAQILRKLLDGEAPPPPRVAAPQNEIPPALEAIVSRAMAAARSERYPDAAALAADVEAYLDQRAVAAHAEGLGEALRRLAGRHQVALLTGLVTGLALLLGFGLSVLAIRGWRDEAVEAAQQAHAAEEGLRATQDKAARLHRATRELTQGLRAASDFARLTQRALPEPELLAVHAEHAQRARAAAEAFPAPSPPDDPTQPLRLELQRARERLDGRLAEALLRFQPEALLSADDAPPLIEGLELGEARGLLHARALLRLDRAAEALEALPDPGQLQDPGQAACVDALRLVLDQGRLSAQLHALDQAVLQAPGEAWLRVVRGGVRARLGDFVASRADLEQAARMSPVDAWVAMARLRHAIPLYSNHELISHESSVVARLAPRHAERAGALARIRKLWGRWSSNYESVGEDGKRAGARPWIEARLQEGSLPELEATLLLAEGALLRKRPDLAELDARRVLDARPRHRDAEGFLAEALFEQGKLDEADRVARRGLERFPEDPRLAYVHGAVLYQLGRFGEAPAFLEAGARAWPYGDRAHLLAKCLLELDDPNAWLDGVAAARRAISLDSLGNMTLSGEAVPPPMDPNQHRTLAELRLRQGLPLLAAVHLARALLLSTHPDYTRDHGEHLNDALALGQLHERLGLPGVAATYYERAQRDANLAAAAARHLQNLGRGPR
jgi:tetratricopeptide (TPR) repeat protein/tRNA A-37 threonylcarbamoyl transferase component Bud32